MIALDAAAQQRVGAVEFVLQRVLRQMFRRFQRRTGGEVIRAGVEAEGKRSDMACDDVVLRRFADAQRDVNTVLNQADAAIVHHHFQRHIRIAAQVIGKMRLQQRALYFHRYRQAQHTLRRVQTLPHAANCLFGAIQHHPRTPASRPSPSPCKVKSPTATAPATAAPSPPATCNG